MTNYFIQHYIASSPKGDSWEEIDEQIGMKVTAFTYITLFLNDQVYAYEATLEQEIRKSSLFKGSLKYIFNKLHKAVGDYNRLMFRTLKGSQQDTMADILSSLEEELKPSIDTYMYQVSQYLLDNGISGENNRFASLASTINMLAQTSNITIKVFNDDVCRKFRIANNPLQYLNMDKVKHLSGLITDLFSPKGKTINLNEGEGIIAAFNAFNNRLLYSGAFTRAIEKAG